MVNTSRRPAWIFDHGADCEADGIRYWICRYCHHSKHYNMGVFKGTGTANQADHLGTKHGVFNPANPPRSSNSPSRSVSSTPRSFSLVTPFSDVQFKQRFTDTVIKLDLTFRQAVSEELRELIIMGGPAAKAMLAQSPSCISKWIKLSFEDRREKVKQMVSRSRSKINISTDIWTADEGNKRAYCAVNAHFVDHSGALRTGLLAFGRILGSHSGENIAPVLLRCFQQYNCTESIGYIICDNADNNDTAIRVLQEDLPILYPSCRVRCIGHIINLVVKAILFGQGVSKLEQSLLGKTDDDAETFMIWSNEGAIGKLHNICVFVNRNDQRRTAFQAFQSPEERELDEDHDLEGDTIFYYVLLVDSGVRWHSVYYMIKRGKKLTASRNSRLQTSRDRVL